MTEERNSFKERMRLGLLDYVAIFSLHLLTFGCINLEFINSKITFLTTYLSRSKIWWTAVILAFSLTALYKKLKLNTFITTIVSIPFIALFLTFSLIKLSQNTVENVFSLENFILLSVALIILSIISMLISFSKKIENYFFLFGGIIILLFFFGRFVFFEEYFFSRINNPELFTKIKPLIDSVFLIIISVFWIGISSKSLKNQNEYASIFVLIYAAFFTFLYFLIFQNAIKSGLCNDISIQCVRALW